MPKPVEAALSVINLRERVIIALDVDSEDAAREIVSELNGQVGAFKVGLQLFMAAGSSFVRELVDNGSRIFLDLKFHDIPNTVAKASIEAARLGVWMFNVHVSGGGEMMRAAKVAVAEVCRSEKLTTPLMIGVTSLTSSNNAVLHETGVNDDTGGHVLRLGTLAAESGLDGVVASAREAVSLREAISRGHFLIVTPGIRPKDATADDQKRVTTLEQAIAAGSDYAVIGRPVTQATDRTAALGSMIETAENVLNA